MSNRSHNPFDLTKASDYSDRQVFDYWVDVEESGGLIGFLKPKSLVPMFLLGGKGSGKTHLMRYCSSSVQSLRHESLHAAVQAEGYIGIYMIADGLNAPRFSGKGQTDDAWAAIFAYSFELWLTGVLLTSALPALEPENTASDTWNKKVVNEISRLMQIPPAADVSTIADLVEHLRLERQNVDRAINNCAITRKIEGISIAFNPGDLAFGIPPILAANSKRLKNVIFVYLIDEVENFTLHQQRFLNSLVRYRKGNTSIKIGARLYGIKTKETLGAGEPIKRDAEYEEVRLDAMFREHLPQYESLARQLVVKRIEASGLASLAPDDLPKHFATLDPTN
jgi:hypothetical protein